MLSHSLSDLTAALSITHLLLLLSLLLVPALLTCFRPTRKHSHPITRKSTGKANSESTVHPHRDPSTKQAVFNCDSVERLFDTRPPRHPIVRRRREFQFSELLAKFQRMEELPPPPGPDEVEMIHKQGEMMEGAQGGKG